MPSTMKQIIGIFLFNFFFEYNRMGVLYNSLITYNSIMAPFENLKIEHLSQQDANLGTELKTTDQLNSYFNDKFFDDLKNNKCKIKKFEDTYIFEQQDPSGSLLDKNQNFTINKFSVKEKVFDKYMANKEKKENKELKDDYDLADFFNTISVSQNLGNLENEVNNNIEGVKSDIEQISSLIGQYDKYSDLKKGDLIDKTRDGKETLKDIKKEAKYRVKLLTGIKGDILNRKNKDVYQKDIDTCTRDIPAFEIAWQKANLGERGMVPRILHDRKSIEKYNVKLQDYIIESQEIDNALADTTLMTLLAADEKDFRDYLEDVISGEIEHPAQNKFYAKHLANFEYIKDLNPTLYAQYDWFMNSDKIIKYCTTSPSGAPKTCKKKESIRDKGGDLLVDGLASLGIIDKNNPKQVEACKTGGKWLMIGGLALLGIQTIRMIFSDKDKNKNKRGKAIGYGGAFFALLNADKLINWGKAALGFDGKNNTIDSEKVTEQTGLDKKDIDSYITPGYTTIAALGGTPINTLINNKYLTENNGKIELDYEKYKEYISSQNIDQKAKDLALENLEELNKDDKKLTEGLSSFGITKLAQLKEISKDNDNITLLDSKNVSDHFERVTSPVNKDLAEEGLKPKNADAWYKITQEFKKDKTDNDDQIIKWMRDGLLEPIDNEASYKIEDMLKNKSVDLLNKKMIGFGNIEFKGYSDLFGAVQLTDFIKETFKDKSTATNTNSDSPFHYGMTTIGNIEFDNQERYKVWENETNVVNSNWFKNTLAEMSPTLDEHKNDYITYLNERWKNKN